MTQIPTTIAEYEDLQSKCYSCHRRIRGAGESDPRWQLGPLAQMGVEHYLCCACMTALAKVQVLVSHLTETCVVLAIADARGFDTKTNVHGPMFERALEEIHPMIKRGFFSEHWNDEQGRPAGGVSSGRGFAIWWQNGPLGSRDQRREPNGAFVEDVMEACIGRLEFFQRSPFACDENADAIANLKDALVRLEARTQRRIAAGVEGTHAK